MRKQTWIVNVLLIAAAAGLAVKLRGDWILANQRYGQLSATVAPKRGATPLGGSNPALNLPAAEARSNAIVQNNLFSPDRNNSVSQLVQSTPPPPLPVFTGSLDLGNGRPIALMVDGVAQPGTMPRSVHEGETIGSYKLVKIAGSFVTVEYEGQQKRVELQLTPMQRSAPAAYAETPRTPSAPAAVVNVGPASAPPPVRPGSQTSTGYPDTRTSHDMFGADGVDHYEAGTVVDGWKKITRASPFGTQVWWERVKQ